MLIFALAGATPNQNVADMRAGKAITLKARVGERVAARESPGTFVFTIRDDFGGMTLGETHHNVADMRFGATYLLSGIARRDPDSQQLVLDVESWQLAYGAPIGWYLLGAAVVVAGIGSILFLLARRVMESRPKEPWEFVEVLSGPDQGLLIPLRENRILVGRKQDPLKEVCLPQDEHVSRKHGILSRQSGVVYFEDTDSRCGSFVNEQRVEPGRQVRVPPGALLRLGPHTVLRVGTAPNDNFDSDTRNFEDIVHADSLPYRPVS